MDQRSLFGLTEHLAALSKHGDPLEVLEATVDFEHFRGWLVEGLGYGDGSKGGRPPFDPVSMFKGLILQAQHNLSDARMEFMIRDRLSWMRFLGYDLGGPTPDENTIRLFRDKLTASGTLKRVMKAFDWQLQKKGYIPMGGQIVDASLVPAPKQRNTDGEKEAIKAGKSAKEIWPDDPNKAAQKDTNARWTLKVGGKVRYRPDGTPLPMIAVPVFGTRATSPSTAGSASSARTPSHRPRSPTDGCSGSSSRPGTRRATSGPTAHTAPKATRNGWLRTC
jgi:transposase